MSDMACHIRIKLYGESFAGLNFCGLKRTATDKHLFNFNNYQSDHNVPVQYTM